MKLIKYKLCIRVNHGTEESPDWVDNISQKTMGYSKANEEIAKKEAYNGEYTIEDDGEPEPTPSQLDIIEAQVTYTAMMTDTLLEV